VKRKHQTFKGCLKVLNLDFYLQENSSFNQKATIHIFAAVVARNTLVGYITYKFLIMFRKRFRLFFSRKQTKCVKGSNIGRVTELWNRWYIHWTQSCYCAGQ